MDGQINELATTDSVFNRKKIIFGKITRNPHLGNRGISISTGEILQPIKSVTKMNEYSL